MKAKFSYIFFWAIGISGLYILTKIAVTGDERILLINFENPLIKYSLPLFAANMSVVLLLIPILMHKGVVSSDYYNADNYAKAKSQFVLLSLSAPGWIFLSIGVYYLGANIGLFLILAGILLFMYVSSIIKLLKNKK